jgi:hypothetical protein
MPIGQTQRQPCGLLTFADEYALIGIANLGCRRHRIASLLVRF